MALVSQPRPRRLGNGFQHGAPPRRRRGRYAVVGLVVIVVLGVGAGALIISSASSSLTTDSQALAQVGLPLGGGKIASVVAVGGRRDRPRAGRGARRSDLAEGDDPGRRAGHDRCRRKAPGLDRVAGGLTERLHLTLVRRPRASTQTYVTLRTGAPLRVHFSEAGRGGLVRAERPARSPATLVTPSQRRGDARAHGRGRLACGSPAPRGRGRPRDRRSSAGSRRAPPPRRSPTRPPGARSSRTRTITLTFSKTVARRSARSMPPVSPITAGAWHQVNSHTIVFRPEGYGYGLGAHVKVASRRRSSSSAAGDRGPESGRGPCPPGSTVRLQQLLATLGYLPLTFSGAPVPLDAGRRRRTRRSTRRRASSSWRYGQHAERAALDVAAGRLGRDDPRRRDGVRERPRADRRRSRPGRRCGRR